MKSSIAAAAISPTHVAAAAPTGEPGRAVLISDLVTLATPTADTWLQLNSWLGDSYTRAPALMVVLAALVALPPLAFAGFMLRRQSRRSPDVTVRIGRQSHRTESPVRNVTARTEMSSWPTEAWVEIGGHRYVIGRTMLRIGREADNDVCLMQKTVHRYHAVIRRSTDGDVVITDVSGADGNGVMVNGKRVGEGRLKSGDVIGIGEVTMKFDARPI
jgi:hypothetical protein